MKNYPKGTHRDILSAMIISGLCSFILYAVVYHVVKQFYNPYKYYSTPYYSYYAGLGDLCASLVAIVLFIGLFHIFYTKKQNKRYYYTVDPDKPFSKKEEFARFGKENILPLLHVYGVLAVINWAAVIFYIRPVAAVLFFVFPFNPNRLDLVSSEVWCLLSPILSAILIIPAVWLLAVHSRRKLHEEKIRERELRKTWSSSNNQ